MEGIAERIMKKTEKKKQQVIYYTDELNDEFSTAVITPKYIGKDWRYIHTSFWKKLTHFFWYRIVAVPIAFFYLKCKFSHKIVGRKKIKGYSGYFLYGNHTQPTADALIPTFVSRPKDVYVIVHANNVSMPVLGAVTPSLGAMPLPDDLQATKNFIQAVEYRIKQKKVVCIYPEAHIWPYYTGIRPFTDKSFHYPVKYNTPVFCFTNTYQKGAFRRIKLVTYVDGPFFPKEELSLKERKEALREEVYAAMCERAKNNQVEKIKYIKKDD